MSYTFLQYGQKYIDPAGNLIISAIMDNGNGGQENIMFKFQTTPTDQELTDQINIYLNDRNTEITKIEEEFVKKEAYDGTDLPADFILFAQQHGITSLIINENQKIEIPIAIKEGEK